MTQTLSTTKQQRTRRQFEGVVVRAPKDKTVAVRVDRIVTHPKYKKHYTASRVYPVHDERDAARIGDSVMFEECRPLSKTKRWRLVSVVS